MPSWTTANTQLRADRDAMDEAKRREEHARAATTAGAAQADCGCTAGSVCRQNSACPRFADASTGI